VSDTNPSVPSGGLRSEIASATSAWSGPNERTAAVDAALVRIARALDSAAVHHVGHRPKRLDLIVESSAQSILEFTVGIDGRWAFEDGSWVADGHVMQSRLLRPSIRGIARATRPDFESALADLVRDVEVACAERIAVDGGADGLAIGGPQTVDDLLEHAFAGLSKADRDALRSLASPVDVGAGTALMHRGASGDEAMFLLGGKVTVETTGGPIVLGPGSVVGERASLTGQPRDATVRALTDVVLLVIKASAIPSLPDAVREVLSNKVRV
jgi:hypothetical protein